MLELNAKRLMNVLMKMLTVPKSVKTLLDLTIVDVSTDMCYTLTSTTAQQSVHKVVTMEEPVLILMSVDVIPDGRDMTAKKQSVHMDVTMGDYVWHLRLVHAV